MKHDLDRTGMKKDKNGKNCMHWNVAPDALCGSVSIVRILDRWLNDCVTCKCCKNA